MSPSIVDHYKPAHTGPAGRDLTIGSYFSEVNSKIERGQGNLYIEDMDSQVPEKICPRVERAFELLGRKWAGLIIHVLSEGPLYFCEIERAIPSVSARMLTERVKELETVGIVSRTVHTDTPVRVSYRLAEKGRALIPVMKGIERWARTWAEVPAGKGSAS